MTSPLLTLLEQSERILIAGAGGGFDVFSGLPLYKYLKDRKKTVFLANLSFSGGHYPERDLGEYLSTEVHCFPAGGFAELHKTYLELQSKLDFDTVLLVDGGTDSLLRGDEPGLGSPGEDVASIAAVHKLEVPRKLLISLGFGIDRHHHVCHAHVLEAVSDLTRKGGFLGAFSLLPEMPEFQFFADVVRHVCARKPEKASIVATSIVAAGEGLFGDVHLTRRTHGSKLFLNPLMAMYWAFQVDALAKRCLYMDEILKTRTRSEITRAIHGFRASISKREWMPIPL